MEPCKYNNESSDAHAFSCSNRRMQQRMKKMRLTKPQMRRD